MENDEMITYYLYNNIPGAHPSWTLAVLAVSQRDADQYVKNYNKGGTRAGIVRSGKVEASCGAITPSAEKFLKIAIDE
jgi:hypothetical protein